MGKKQKEKLTKDDLHRQQCFFCETLVSQSIIGTFTGFFPHYELCYSPLATHLTPMVTGLLLLNVRKKLC